MAGTLMDRDERHDWHLTNHGRNRTRVATLSPWDSRREQIIRSVTHRQASGMLPYGNAISTFW